jgi:ketosteroid isomerase-like protein
MRNAPLMTLLATALACRTTPPVPPPVDEAVEARAVEQVLNDWYGAMARYDSAGIADAMTPTFFILEDTIPLDKAELMRRIMAGRGQGTQSARLTGLRTRVVGEVAWTTMRNEEIWTPAKGAPDSMAFLETVVFEKVNGWWRIDRYHAAKLPRTTASPAAP